MMMGLDLTLLIKLIIWGGVTYLASIAQFKL